MSASKAVGSPFHRRTVHPQRAVIDIGSNTVRLVIYEGPGRAPETVWNEKVAARLGRDLAASAEIPPEAEEEALAALARYALIIRDRGIEDVQTVATAAARDARNGADFLEKIVDLGLHPQLLTGEEEACASAMGVVGAFPSASGTMADLGGGSLELATLRQGDCSHAVSLPFGTLRLPELLSTGHDLAGAIRNAMGLEGGPQTGSGPLYLVGGTWRAFAYFAMARRDYPLTDPHGFCLTCDEADHLAKALQTSEGGDLGSVAGISEMRAAYLPDAAHLLLVLLSELKPTSVVFSSWGLREGLLYSRLNAFQRDSDPLLAGVQEFCSRHDAAIVDAARLADWSADITLGHGKRTERLRLATAQFASALQRVEPNLREGYACEWTLEKRWVACTPRDRAMMCAALFGSLGRTQTPDTLRYLATEDERREAIAWGLSFRLARRLGAGSGQALASSRLRLGDETLTLHLDRTRAALATASFAVNLEKLAQWLDRKARIEIDDHDFPNAPDKSEI